MSEYVDNLWNPHLGNPPGVTGWGVTSPRLIFEFVDVATSASIFYGSDFLKRTAHPSVTSSDLTAGISSNWSPFSDPIGEPSSMVTGYEMGGVFHYSFRTTHISGALGSRVGNTYKVIIRSPRLSSSQGYNGFGDIVSGGQHFQCESAVFSPSI